MKKVTIWQRFGGECAPATGALVFACLLATVTVWFSSGALGPWIAFLGLCAALATLAIDSLRARDLLFPLFLGLAGLGLSLFSGGFLGAAACAILWPILGGAARGGRFESGAAASFGALFVLGIGATYFQVPATQVLGSQAGILVLGVSGALALAACMRSFAAKPTSDGAIKSQLEKATKDRDVAFATAKEAIAQSQARSHFMAEMSHEIRTPLNAILGFADTMREGVFGPLPKAYGDYPDLIHTSGTHLLDLVSDLLDLSKIEAGRYETNLKPLRLDDVAYEGIRLSGGTARGAGVQLRHEASGIVEVKADARAVRQIVFNLMSNAIKFTPKGGRVTLRVLIDDELQRGCLEVEDSGVGMSEADLAKIGEPWNQSRQNVDDDAKRSRGSGLGLALVKRLIDLQGGQFEIASTLGVGTRVRVSFPLANPNNASKLPVSSE